MTYKNGDTMVVAHYYSTPEVQQMADFVGDSLELALKIKEQRPERVVHATVRFMAETAKMLVPSAEVILPSEEASCSLVDQTDIHRLRVWDREQRIINSMAGYHTTHVEARRETGDPPMKLRTEG